jgi:GT2 family glycosyltransferase
VLVVVPVYNLPSEEQTYSMIRNLREIIPNVHVLIVNNSSSENSYRKLQETSDWYFVAGENMGIGFSYNLVLLLAKLTNERWILILDQDSQIIDVRELKSLLEKTDSYLLSDNIAIIYINNLNRDNRIFILKKIKIMRGSP